VRPQQVLMRFAFRELWEAVGGTAGDGDQQCTEQGIAASGGSRLSAEFGYVLG